MFVHVSTLILIVFVNVINIDVSGCEEYNGFDDAVMFKLNWPGEEVDSSNFAKESIIVTSPNQEKYRCNIPSIEKNEVSQASQSVEVPPIELLKPLFEQTICSYRLDTYWTYEVCHGRHIRQYHEERVGKKIKLQEYYLGQWDKNEQQKNIERLKTGVDIFNKKPQEIPTKRVGGIQRPYFEITMDGGTLCDLNNKPRQTKVLYVCYKTGKHEVYSLKEMATCEYEVIILSPLLCKHPSYKPAETGVSDINCVPLDDAPPRPIHMILMEASNLKTRTEAIKVSSEWQREALQDKILSLVLDAKTKEGDQSVHVEIRSVDLNDDLTKDVEKSETEKSTSNSGVKMMRQPWRTMMGDFLTGRKCLVGGTGWWKYEYCHNKHVRQFHEEKDKPTTTINLGTFDVDKHLAWMEKNPGKKLSKTPDERKQFSQFYSDGDVCDKTGVPRQTEVKLKCVMNTHGALQMYLLEPKYCEYILGIESPLVCDFIKTVDENGLTETNSETSENSHDTIKRIFEDINV